MAVRSVLVASVMLLSACSSGPSTSPSISQGNTPQQLRAMAMWKERCETKSGVFIHRTVENVEGVYLVNVRKSYEHSNSGGSALDQFRLSDPYGRDATGHGYLRVFLRGSFQLNRKEPLPAGHPPHQGYFFVEAYDPFDGKLYRFTGRIDEPWKRMPEKALPGHLSFELDRSPIAQRTARYGVKFEDISTREERELWIAGSSLKVIDLETNEVLAERIGYMVDWAQGSRAGARQPWTFAADNACPDFRSDYPEPFRSSRDTPGFQIYQSLRFAEKVLKPQP
ncbi:MAG: hypothetical protein J0L58_03675 [Burkholderiales bacterium]|nr:hypothetical protein [Burkholderiales bacterium]